MTDRQRRALVLHEQGFRQVEIAKIMGIAQPNVHKLLRRARRHFSSRAATNYDLDAISSDDVIAVM